MPIEVQIIVSVVGAAAVWVTAVWVAVVVVLVVVMVQEDLLIETVVNIIQFIVDFLRKLLKKK